MVARSTRSNQRPDTLMQDRKPTARRKPLATHGPTIHWVNRAVLGASRAWPLDPNDRTRRPSSRCAGVVATACTQGKRTQHGRPQGVVRDDQPDEHSARHQHQDMVPDRRREEAAEDRHQRNEHRRHHRGGGGRRGGIGRAMMVCHRLRRIESRKPSFDVIPAGAATC
jgi:hypothetical protein